MHIAALLLLTAVSQTPPEAIFQDGYDAGADCPAVIQGSTGPLALRQVSDILYRNNLQHVRHNVVVTDWDNIWGHIDEFDDLMLWPGVPGASPTIRTVGKHEYIAAKFHVPIDALPTLSGRFKHVLYGGGPNVDATISRSCGDFENRALGCWQPDWMSNDNYELNWRVSSSNHLYCHLDPGQDYYFNIRFTDPETIGPDCQSTSCQMTFQQSIAY